MSPDGNSIVCVGATGSRTVSKYITVSGTTPTLQETVIVHDALGASSTGKRSVQYIPVTDSWLVLSTLDAGSQRATAMQWSGSAQVFGSTINAGSWSGATHQYTNHVMNYPVITGAFICNTGNSGFYYGTVSGTTITTRLSGGYLSEFTHSAYNSDSGMHFTGYTGGSTNYSMNQWFRYTNDLTGNFIGFSEGSYTNGQTANITVVGGTNTAVTSLQSGSRYYIQLTGSLGFGYTTNIAGQALSSTSILVKG
jgi:hypothetical protein